MTETEKIEQVHKYAKDAAEYWQANFKPVAYSTPMFINGDWVRVTIELITESSAYDRGKTTANKDGTVTWQPSREPDALKRLQELTSDRSADA